MMGLKPSVYDRLRAWILALGRAVFSDWVGVEDVVRGHAASARGPGEDGGTWEESRKTLFF